MKTVEELSAELESSNKKIAELVSLSNQLPEIKKGFESLKAENENLKVEVAKRTQESQLLTIKTEYPDVPLDLLPKGSFDEQKAYAAKLTEWKGSRGSNPTVTIPENPATAWMNSGRISPASDAELAAKKAELDKVRQDAKAKGDVNGVIQAITSANGAKIARLLGFRK